MKKLFLVLAFLLSAYSLGYSQKTITKIGEFNFPALDTTKADTFSVYTDPFGLDYKDSMAFFVVYDIYSTTKKMWVNDTLVFPISDTLKMMYVSPTGRIGNGTWNLLYGSSGWNASMDALNVHYGNNIWCPFVYTRACLKLKIYKASGVRASLHQKTIRATIYKVQR